jgi:hypothetical protein
MEHRASYLKISGKGLPEVTSLYNSRNRCEYRCVGFASTDWYYTNKDKIFADFGSLSDAQIIVGGTGGSTPITDSVYPNMRLMRNALEYTPSGEIVVYFLYETLTSSFVQEAENKVDVDSNGLRRVTRPVIAKRDTSYSLTVGTSTISHSGDGYSALTLTLASAIEDDKPSDLAGYTRIVETWVEAGVLSVSQDFKASGTEVSVQSIGLTASEVSSTLSEVTSGHKVVSEVESDYEGFTARTFVFELETHDLIDTEVDGLRRVNRAKLLTAGTVYTSVVGTTTISHQIDSETAKTLYLTDFKIVDTATYRVVQEVWVEAGIRDVEKLFDEDGLLYVTFISQGTKFIPTALNGSYVITDDPLLAFQGGSTAILFRDRQRNVNGFRLYTITVAMKKDGSVLADGNVVKSKTTWVDYEYPGYVNTTFNSGVVPVPGGNISILVTETETMTTSNTVGISDVPFSIKQGCWINVNYTPASTGLAESINKAFGTNFLAGSVGLAGSNATFLGMEVSSIAGGGGSNPSYSGFLATSTPILLRDIDEDLVTDGGVQWYRIKQTQLVDTFGDYD